MAGDAGFRSKLSLGLCGGCACAAQLAVDHDAGELIVHWRVKYLTRAGMGRPRSILPAAQAEKELLNEGPDDAEKEPSCTCREFFYGVADAVFASLCVAPLVVGIWRGVWGLMELHRPMFPIVQSFLLGIVLHVGFVLVREQLFERSADAWRAGAGRWLRERALSRLYSVTFTFACIAHWRGGWGLFDAAVAWLVPDESDPHRPAATGAATLLPAAALLYLRAARNLLAPPYFVVTDGKLPTYQFTTRFRISSNKDTALYLLDCVFSVSVVTSLVVFVWRGSWALLDMSLFPDAPAASCAASLAIGYTLVVITFGLQVPMRWAVARLAGAPRLLVADVYHFVSFLATVNVWRGVWIMCDLYLFPEYPELSNWCTSVGSLALLVLLNCSNSVLVRGVYIDAEEPGGECVVFPCHYLRLHFHKERTKKLHRKALAAAAASARHHEEASLAPLRLPALEEKV